MDIAGDDTGVVSATMNTAGQIGSFLRPLVVTALLRRSGNWNLPLIVMGCLFLFGAICRCIVNPLKRALTGQQEANPCKT